jgi:hypothetical protein
MDMEWARPGAVGYVLTRERAYRFTVVRLTATQIVTTGTTRFRRQDGREVGVPADLRGVPARLLPAGDERVVRALQRMSELRATVKVRNCKEAFYKTPSDETAAATGS